jgi:hypothetical protein
MSETRETNNVLQNNPSQTISTMKWSQPDPLHLILRQPLLCAVVELRRAWALVRSHVLGVLKLTAIGEVSGNAGCTEGMVADRRHKSGRNRPSSDHAPGVGLAHLLVREHDPGVPWAGAEQATLAVLGDTGSGDIGMERLSQRVMAGHGVLLAAFLM